MSIDDVETDVHFGEGMEDTNFITDSNPHLVASKLVHHGLSFVADHKFGEGVGDRFNKCVAYAVEKICIWDISALKWGKLLLQIFPDPRGSRFLARTCSFVRRYGYGCARTWRIVCWCGYGYNVW